MITICTHNSFSSLNRLLESIYKFSKNAHKIHVVETSNINSSQAILEKYDCLYTHTNNKYEVGAYNETLLQYPDEQEYYMFQDSLEIICSDWENYFKAPIQHNIKEDCFISFWKFDINDFYAHEHHHEALKMYNKFLKRDIKYKYGTSSQVFYMTNNCAKKIYLDSQKFIINSKLEACGMERIWTNLAYDHGYIPKFSVDYLHPETGYKDIITKHYLLRE